MFNLKLHRKGTFSEQHQETPAARARAHIGPGVRSETSYGAMNGSSLPHRICGQRTEVHIGMPNQRDSRLDGFGPHVSIALCGALWGSSVGRKWCRPKAVDPGAAQVRAGWLTADSEPAYDCGWRNPMVLERSATKFPARPYARSRPNEAAAPTERGGHLTHAKTHTNTHTVTVEENICDTSIG